jgi:hypoxanthine phosphoribosyltransferase
MGLKCGKGRKEIRQKGRKGGGVAMKIKRHMERKGAQKRILILDEVSQSGHS